jgi:hypothetical protein
VARNRVLERRRLGFLVRHRVYRDLGEFLLVALAFLLYFVVRANVVDRPDLAIANARHLVEAERWLGLFHEARWQEWALEHHAVVKFCNFAYFWLDFPLIAAVGILLYFRQRPVFTFTRDAILFSGAVALVVYAFLPMAPPRLVPGLGIEDTLQAYNHLSYQAQSTQFFVNPYAAMPSLHVGWAVLLAIGVWRAFPRQPLLLALAAVHPLSQWASTVLTGNHFVLDGAGGLVAAVLGLGFAVYMQRRGYRALGRFIGVTEPE